MRQSSSDAISRSVIHKIHRFLWNPKDHHLVYKNLPLDPNLSQMNPVHIFVTYFIKVNFNINLPSTPSSSK
jgi:hypothetical protein